MKTSNNTIPSIATHPGEMILDELEAIEMSQSDFAIQIGFKKSQLNEIIKGKRNINAELALLLQESLGIDADYWMEAQKNYDLDKARIEKKNQERIDAIAMWRVVEAQIAKKFLKKQKVIIGDPIEDLETIKDVYGINDFNELSGLNTLPIFSRFRKSTKLQYDTTNIIAWVKLVHYRAKQINVKRFNAEKKDVLIEKLKIIFFENKDVLNRVTELLAEYGIKLIFQEKGEKTPIDGVSFWSGNNPAIGMTLRHSRLDNFAFTLFHELGHIFEHLPNSNCTEFIDLLPAQENEDYKNSIEEKEANNFALNNLINKEAWNDFFSSTNIFSDEIINYFAYEVGMHPSIVRGRICHQIGNYKAKTRIDYKIH